MAVTDRDLGWKAIKREVERAQRREVAVGILQGSNDSEGASIAEYATYNEFGTEDVPSRPFMAMSFDENVAAIMGTLYDVFCRPLMAREQGV